MKYWKKYDVVVIGGGHAGAEAAMAASGMGATTLLLTQNLDTLCQMSCNPAMGGVAKGQIVREVDALGGWSGIVTDRATLQFRMLNRSKGPAMWSPRAQCDKWYFSAQWRQVLEHQPGLDLWQDEATELLYNGHAVAGVRTRLDIEIEARAVIITAGTFLNGRIYIGEVTVPGGRIGERAAEGLSNSLKERGLQVEKLKTGTPMRVKASSIDFARMEPQPGDDSPQKFSFADTPTVQQQMPCYLTYTNEHTHEILRTGFSRSPLFTGRIQGRGPRYCPSIEDKIERFADKTRHQLFVEPEGRHSQSYYVNGFSSSLPLEVQVQALHSIVGFEHADILKPGYAIEYDYFSPTQLRYTLESKLVENLYFAGQVNGTTGYEEAACQGLMAGINAALKLAGRLSFVLNRSQAYIGVLIDDLVTKGVNEPYRMFTSRAEYRILLRQDNADERLTPLSHAIGLASAQRMQRVEEKQRHITRIEEYLRETSVVPSEVNALLVQKHSPELQQKVKLHSLLLRTELTMQDMPELSPALAPIIEEVPEPLREAVVSAVEIRQKYSRYIEKEQQVAEKILKFENLALPEDMDYFGLQALSYEAREKLTQMRPKTIGQASRISGVSPADVSVLVIYLGRASESKA